MALKQLELVGNEVLSTFVNKEVHKIAIHHRVGMLEVGDISLLVAVSAVHRAQAFEAANLAVNRVKETVPIWKKEYGQNGAIWQEGVTPRPVTK